MTWLAVLGTVAALLLAVFKFFTGKDRQAEKKRKEVGDEIKKGIEDRDPSRITGGFDDLNGMR